MSKQGINKSSEHLRIKTFKIFKQRVRSTSLPFTIIKHKINAVLNTKAKWIK